MITVNTDVRRRLGTTVAFSMKQSVNTPNMAAHDKKKRKIILIEVDIIIQSRLQAMECKKGRRYNVLANEMETMNKHEARTIPFVFAWNGIAAKFYKSYS